MTRRLIIFHRCDPLDHSRDVVITAKPLTRIFAWANPSDPRSATLGISGTTLQKLRALGLKGNNTGRWVEVLYKRAPGSVRVDRRKIGACSSGWVSLLGTCFSDIVYLRPIGPVESLPEEDLPPE